jgi:hypothetical protein
MEAKWWQYLTWPFESGELKTYHTCTCFCVKIILDQFFRTEYIYRRWLNFLRFIVQKTQNMQYYKFNLKSHYNTKF